MTPGQLASDLEGLLISCGQPDSLTLHKRQVLDIVAVLRSCEADSEAQRDAERYRWLRQDNGQDEPFVCIYDGHAFSRWTNEHADAAIDAALGRSVSE